LLEELEQAPPSHTCVPFVAVLGGSNGTTWDSGLPFLTRLALIVGGPPDLSVPPSVHVVEVLEELAHEKVVAA
jgi:hypothetical protein